MVSRMNIPSSTAATAHGSAPQVKPEHDPEKWIPVFGKDHAPTKG
jgi:hypothetical protein